jgi:trk system potassium uptake protein TrkA
MNVLIMGCGRLGARVATMLDSAGHTVTVLDTNPASFRRGAETPPPEAARWSARASF